MTSPLYPIFEKRIADATQRIIRTQVEPWSFMRQQLRVETFDGRTIAYSGCEFDGSSELIFWSHYIEPFLEDLTVKELAAAVSQAKERDVDALNLLPELQGLLLGASLKTFQRMAYIDRRLRGKGFPEKVHLRSIESEYAAMRDFIEKHVQAEIAMWKPRHSYERWFERNKFWVWVVGILIALVGIAFKFL